MNKTGCSAVVAHLSGGQVVAGSNPVTPILIFLKEIPLNLQMIYQFLSFSKLKSYHFFALV